jgi:hypothetical protein
MKLIHILIIAALITALSLPAGDTRAAPDETTITVEIYTDEYLQYSASGTCSLREAITAAVNDAPFGGCPGGVAGESTLISLPGGIYYLSLSGVDDANAMGDLDIYEAAGAEVITISGTGTYSTNIYAGGIDRIFDLNSYANVTLRDLALSNGQSDPGDAHFGAGGGIYSDGNLTLQAVNINTNIAGRGAASAPGGAIFNGGFLNIVDSSVVSNHTLSGFGSASAADGGGIYNNATMLINTSKFLHNYTGDGGGTDGTGASGGNGGGIFNNGSLELGDTLFNQNHTGASSDYLGHGGHGGGVFNAGDAVFYSTTFVANYTGAGTQHAGGNGGGIFNHGTLDLYNATLAYNYTGTGGTGLTTGQGGHGGGLFSDAIASIYLTTIAENFTGSGTPNGNGGGIYITGTTKYLSESIVANNTSHGTSLDCYALLDNPRYNLIENATNCVFNGTPVGNITGLDPMLGPLQQFSDYVIAYPLTRSSPAIDKVLSGCSYATDQRWSSRPIDGDQNGSALCDIGAIEMGMPSFIPMIMK